MTAITRSVRLRAAQEGDPDAGGADAKEPSRPGWLDAPVVEPAQAAQRQGRPPERIPVAGLDRRSILALTAFLVVAWLIFVFSRAVADSTAATARVTDLQAGNVLIEQRLEARQAELAIVQSPAFVALQARAYGLGSAKEQVFSLTPGAPPPPSIRPLGEAPAPAAQPSHLEEWLDLLFGK